MRTTTPGGKSIGSAYQTTNRVTLRKRKPVKDYSDDELWAEHERLLAAKLTYGPAWFARKLGGRFEHVKSECAKRDMI